IRLGSRDQRWCLLAASTFSQYLATSRLVGSPEPPGAPGSRSRAIVHRPAPTTGARGRRGWRRLVGGGGRSGRVERVGGRAQSGRAGGGRGRRRGRRRGGGGRLPAGRGRDIRRRRRLAPGGGRGR